jgi:DNA-binding HxlR family transcriptional regulator
MMCPTPAAMAADCLSRQVLHHVTSRWGTLALVALSAGTHRFSALRRRIGGVSERMLAMTLQHLEADGFVPRRAHHVVPLSGWIETHLPQIMAERPQVAAQ